ncbi:hypothetical protein BI364_10335 [Acidihalobacter yilgarnensis]|uniref:Diguanylate cyclase DosC n=2 Tax=Acidihalobacter yilgarnensis TaxID=2819280 RepID=A0A1D8IPJ5_9GAMM|nr:hypothetical protein BI364_10335 [Acidihalobacter yilgarnensis]
MTAKAPSPEESLLTLQSCILEATLAHEPPQQLLDQICRLTQKCLSRSVASIMVLGKDGRLHIAAAPDVPMGARADLEGLLPGTQAGSCGHAVSSGQAQFITNALTDDRWLNLLPLTNHYGVLACWSHPIVDRNGSIVGSFALSSFEPRHPADFHRQLLQTAATATAIVLEHAANLEHRHNLQRQLTRKLEIYRALVEEDDLVLRADTEYELLQDTCKTLVHDTPFCAVMIVQPTQDGWRNLAAAGPGSRQIETLLPLVDERSLIARAWREGRSLCDNDNLAAVHGTPWENWAIHHHWIATLATPIMRAGVSWAILVFAADQPQVFDGDIEALCQRIAALLGHGLDQIDLRQHLVALKQKEAHAARSDYLTDLPNRLSLEERLREVEMRSTRLKRPYAIVMLDLDGFKPVNDRYGHAVGDLLLIELATRLRKILRESDFIARLGGDEFVLVLEYLDGNDFQDNLSRSMERLHRVVELPFECEGASIRINISAGVALSSVGRQGDTLLREADAALYQAKDRQSGGSWWQTLGRAAQAPKPEFSPINPFSASAAHLLDRYQNALGPWLDGFVEAFYQQLVQDDLIAPILASVTDTEMVQLKQAQAGHLRFLATPSLQRNELQTVSERLGRIHFLTGVDAALLLRANAAYRDLLGSHLNLTVDARAALSLLNIIDARLGLDIQNQVDAMNQARLALRDVLSFVANAALGAMDNLHALISQLGALFGIRAVVLYRPDAEGFFDIVEAEGPAAARGRVQLSEPTYRVGLVSGHPRGKGVVTRAWHSLRIETVDHVEKDAGMTLWRDMQLALDVRSAVAMPLRDAQGHVLMVLALYGAYPHQFTHEDAQAFVHQLQTIAEHLLLMPNSSPKTGSIPLLTHKEQTHLRQRLFGEGLMLYFQPVIDLRTGQMVKIEALARLNLENGEPLLPGEFLPILGAAERYRLFWLTLQQALAALKRINHCFPTLQVTVNLPPSCLLESDLVARLTKVLDVYDALRHRIAFEVLETEEVDPCRAHETLKSLRELGVELALDDLGGGYGSLLRLIQEPFDVLKIDQNVVRRMTADPLSTLILLSTLIRLADDLDQALVVEGLETPDLIEVAQWLRIPLGQGFAIARPMPIEDLPDWVTHFRLPSKPTLPTSRLGLLALLFQHLPGKSMSTITYDNCPGKTVFTTLDVNEGDEVDAWHRRLHDASISKGDRMVALRHLFQWVGSDHGIEHLAARVLDV